MLRDSTSKPAIQTTGSSASPRPRTTRDLTIAQRWLVQIMAEYQFGRIENLRIKLGQPAPDERLSIIRTALLGSRNGGVNVRASDDPELKRSIWDLFDEIEQLQNGCVVRLEFKHGLPLLLETAVPANVRGEPSESEIGRAPICEARTI